MGLIRADMGGLLGGADWRLWMGGGRTSSCPVGRAVVATPKAAECCVWPSVSTACNAWQVGLRNSMSESIKASK